MNPSRSILRLPLLVLALMLALSACSGDASLADSILEDFNLEDTLDDLRDCDLLSDTFVSIVRQAATELDDLAAASGGRVPTAELTNRVDAVAETSYFALAERLGCASVSHRVDLIERMTRLNPDSAAGQDFIDQVLRQIESQT